MTGEEESQSDKEPGHERPFQQIGQGGPVKATRVPMSKWPFQPAPLQMIQPSQVCNYFQRPDHTQQNCRRANGLCLACGFNDHTVEGCLHKRTGMMTRALPALPAPSAQRNSGPVIWKAPLHPRQRAFRPVQKGTRTTRSRGKGQTYNLTAYEVELLKKW